MFSKLQKKKNCTKRTYHVSQTVQTFLLFANLGRRIIGLSCTCKADSSRRIQKETEREGVREREREREGEKKRGDFLK